MRKNRFIIQVLVNMLLSVSIILHAQTIENFETINNWSGDISKFEILENELHLNDISSSGSAYVSTISTISMEATWEVTVKLPFSPSASNKLEIVIMSDKQDVTNDYHGYYLSVGESGANDALELYRKDIAGSTLLGRGIEARFSDLKDSIKIKVTRDSDYNWRVSTDIGIGYENEISVKDNTYLQSNFFGLHCIYTSTRNNLFYFDNLKINGSEWKDTLAPQLISLEISSDSTINLLFDELLDTPIISNFLLDNTSPFSVEIVGNEITLLFNPFEEDKEMSLVIVDIKDEEGNISTRQSQIIKYHRVQLFDLVVSELLFDPEAGDFDYIEIYNNSEIDFSISDIVLESIDLETKEVLQSKIFPSGFVFLSHTFYVFTEDKVALVSRFNNILDSQVVEMDIPTMNNDQGSLRLVYQDSILLDRVSYEESYHASFINDVENVALERINLTQHASDASNWFSASEAIGFGSPTLVNSANKRSANSNFELDNNSISPDGDGYDDFAMLQFQNIENGTLMNVSIFNGNGVFLNRLYHNYYIQGTGQVKIEGVTQSGNILSPNIYLLFVEVFDVSGNVKKIKKILTVNARF